MNVLSVSPQHGRYRLKQGDNTELKFILQTNDANVSLSDSAKVVMYKDNKITFTKSVTISNSVATFSIDKVLSVGIHLVEIIVGNKHIFPSDRSSCYIEIVQSSENLVASEVTDYGVQKIKNEIKADVTPTIDKDGTWLIGGKDTGLPSRGVQGPKGDPGPQGKPGEVTLAQLNAELAKKLDNRFETTVDSTTKTHTIEHNRKTLVPVVKCFMDNIEFLPWEVKVVNENSLSLNLGEDIPDGKQIRIGVV